jgi:hypothetical protein
VECCSEKKSNQHQLETKLNQKRIRTTKEVG